MTTEADFQNDLNNIRKKYAILHPPGYSTLSMICGATFDADHGDQILVDIDKVSIDMVTKICLDDPFYRRFYSMYHPNK